MSAASYPFQIVKGVPVVTAPADIDAATDGELGKMLLEWHTRGHTTVVVDMTGTKFCALAGLRELVSAHQRALAEGGSVRLVIPAGSAILRPFALIGLDPFIPRFTSIEHALAQTPVVRSPS